MLKTRNDLAAASRGKMVNLLGAQLASAIDLQLATKQAHWNVKGPAFIALHEFFDQLAARLTGHVDEMAERITALGGIALGGARRVARESALESYPEGLLQGEAHLDALAERYAALTKNTRAAIKVAARVGDEVTADLFNEITAALDKDLWLLEAHASHGPA
jgi:starvation-inducible DNA-binding protein